MLEQIVELAKEGTPGEKEEAAGVLVMLLCHGDDDDHLEIVQAIVDANAIPVLSALVEKSTDGAKLEAAAALCFISAHGSFTSERAFHAPFQAPVAAARVPEQMVMLVEQGTSDQAVWAAGTLGELAGSNDPAIAKAIIDAGAIPVLSALLEKGTGEEPREMAVKALWDISIHPSLLHMFRCQIILHHCALRC